MARAADVIEQSSTRFEEVFSQASGGPLAIREAQEIAAEKNLFGEVITAQPCKVPRDEGRVLAKIKVMAAAAGERWYYRFPVWNQRKRRQEHIEGISIDGTDAVARYYGNCRVESMVVDHPGFWMIYSRFVDLETGYTLVRPFKADKEGAKLKSEDRGRLEQIAIGIGISKGQRIVVDHALRDFTNYAFEEAKNSIVDKIGKNLVQYRERCVAGLSKLGPGIVARVEAAYGRKAADWLAHDLAGIIAEMRAIADGLESVDETWPAPAPTEPKRSDTITDVPVAESPSATEAAAASPAPPADGHSVAGDAPPPVERSNTARTDWSLPDGLMGQDAIIRALHELLQQVETGDQLDLLLDQNSGRIAKITGTKLAEWRNAVRARREQLGGEP